MVQSQASQGIVQSRRVQIAKSLADDRLVPETGLWEASGKGYWASPRRSRNNREARYRFTKGKLKTSMSLPIWVRSGSYKPAKECIVANRFGAVG